MKEKVTISLDICIPEHCYECPFWAGEDFKHIPEGMTSCLFPQIPEWGRTYYEVFPPEDKECLCPLLKKARNKKMNDILTITKEELVDILTKSGRYHEEGIKSVLDRESLAGVLRGIMCDIDSLEHGKNYYKEEVRCLRSEREEMEKYIEMLESGKED